MGRTDCGDELEGAACGVQLEALVVDEELEEERSDRGGDEGGLQAAPTRDLGCRGEANIERIRRVALLEGHQTKQDGGGGAMELGRTPFHSWEGERANHRERERGKTGGEDRDEVSPGHGRRRQGRWRARPARSARLGREGSSPDPAAGWIEGRRRLVGRDREEWLRVDLEAGSRLGARGKRGGDQVAGGDGWSGEDP